MAHQNSAYYYRFIVRCTQLSRQSGVRGSRSSRTQLAQSQYRLLKTNRRRVWPVTPAPCSERVEGRPGIGTERKDGRPEIETKRKDGRPEIGAARCGSGRWSETYDALLNTTESSYD